MNAQSKVRDHLGRWLLRASYRIEARGDMVRLGSEYGGWVVPAGLIDASSICYCAGVGEDASFDLALIAHFGCAVHAFDPTPRAIIYADRVAAKEPRFTFHPYGLWSENTTLRFFSPDNPAHVSHSALNLQNTRTFFEAPVRNLQSIMRELHHNRIDLLKMDIEGAEHRVLEDMSMQGIWPKVLCVEFDRPFPLSRIRKQLRNLTVAGYRPVMVKEWNFTFALTEDRSK